MRRSTRDSQEMRSPTLSFEPVNRQVRMLLIGKSECHKCLYCKAVCPLTLLEAIVLKSYKVLRSNARINGTW